MTIGSLSTLMPFLAATVAGGVAGWLCVKRQEAWIYAHLALACDLFTWCYIGNGPSLLATSSGYRLIRACMEVFLPFRSLFFVQLEYVVEHAVWYSYGRPSSLGGGELGRSLVPYISELLVVRSCFAQE